MGVRVGLITSIPLPFLSSEQIKRQRERLKPKYPLSEKDKYYISYMWNLKYTNKFIYKTETNLKTQKTNLCLPKGKESEGGIN